MALLHAAVLVGSILALLPDAPSSSGQLMAWMVILLGFAVLRTSTAGRDIPVIAAVLEGIGVAVFLAGTGGWRSPFLLLAISGIWWAAQNGQHRIPPIGVGRGDDSAHRLRLPAALWSRQPGPRLAFYSFALIAAYILLIMPIALRAGSADIAVQNATTLAGFSLLTMAWARARDAWLRSQYWIPALGAKELEIREGLGRAHRTIDIPIDAVLAAGQMGLTATQAELLAYLLLGLANQEIADATQVSEATVRYRLTRLYRMLGVSGRKQAAARARDLGLITRPEPPAGEGMMNIS
jgi:DNA-binding CsgD family transcriptional regulator